MQIYATFEQSIYIELTISELEQAGIKDIFAIPLDKLQKNPQVLDSIYRSDGVSFINKGFALATAFSVVFASWGFTLEWGPIYWGLIGAGGGFILGFLIDWILYKRKHKTLKSRKKLQSEVILIIECNKNESRVVKDILEKNSALGFAKIDHELE